MAELTDEEMKILTELRTNLQRINERYFSFYLFNQGLFLGICFGIFGNLIASLIILILNPSFNASLYMLVGALTAMVVLYWLNWRSNKELMNIIMDPDLKTVKRLEEKFGNKELEEKIGYITKNKK